jgi:hypothetical protein
MALVDELLVKFQEQQDKANEMNEKRYEQGLGIFDQIIEQYKSGGSFEKSVEGGLERGEKKAVASGTQALVSAGLSNTTQAGGLSKKYQEEVAAPARLQAADVSNQRTAEALQQKAGFVERREDVGPSYETIAGLAKSIGAGQQTGGGGQQKPANYYQRHGRWGSNTSRGINFINAANPFGLPTG